MPTRHIVVDGSNIATEGRSTPSLAQLESAVAELRKEYPDAEIIVVVDATFAHRIDPSEHARFEAAALQGTYVAPPAGAIGRGDAFLLRIAEKVGAMVLSNDSFQEFHGEHPWLFDTGRLLGATPVSGVGWIFIPRTPVRGPRSRVAVRDATRSKNIVERAIADATAEVSAPEGTPKRSRSRRSGAEARPSAATPRPLTSRPGSGPAIGASPRPAAVNEPLAFITFIAEHPLGATVEGVVEGFTSHGAIIVVGPVRGYVPLSGLADPAPRSAREVLRRDEQRTFVITALDPNRRGVELALPGVGVVRGVPSEETVAAELVMSRGGRRPKAAVSPTEPEAGTPPAPRRRRAGAAAAAVGSSDAPDAPAEPATAAPARRQRSKASAPAAATSVATEVPAKRSARVQADPAKPTKRAAKKAAASAKATPSKTPAVETAPPTRRRAASKQTAAPVEAIPAPSEGPRRSPAKKAALKATAVPARKAAPAKARATKAKAPTKATGR